MTTFPDKPVSQQCCPVRARVLVAILSAVVLLAISCTTINHVAESPPQISGATFVGSESCATCHEDQEKTFKNTPHFRLQAKGKKGEAAGCESCHGPGSKHVDAGGSQDTILNPARMRGEAASAQCLSCHSKDKIQAFWKGSPHSGNDAGCASCHQLHGGKNHLLKQKSEAETCFACHAQVRADILKRSKHPLRDSSKPDEEGKMQCSSCHSPHGAKGDKLIAARSINDKCYECHTEKKAPVLWEHSPVKEECLTCHTAHGSNNDKMLVTKVPRLCQQCHMQGRHQTGSLAQNSTFLLNRGCLNCHPMVHGSNNPSGAVLQR